MAYVWVIFVVPSTAGMAAMKLFYDVYIAQCFPQHGGGSTEHR